MTARNDVTGDAIRSKTNSQKYKDNWDRIFNKKNDELTEDSKEGKENTIEKV